MKADVCAYQWLWLCSTAIPSETNSVLSTSRPSLDAYSLNVFSPTLPVGLREEACERFLKLSGCHSLDANYDSVEMFSFELQSCRLTSYPAYWRRLLILPHDPGKESIGHNLTALQFHVGARACSSSYRCGVLASSSSLFAWAWPLTFILSAKSRPAKLHWYERALRFTLLLYVSNPSYSLVLQELQALGWRYHRQVVKLSAAISPTGQCVMRFPNHETARPTS